MEDNGTRIPTEAGSGSPPVTGPYETEREARDAAIEQGGPPREGSSILSEGQRHRMLLSACEQAGISLGAYDFRIIGWLTHLEDATCAVIAGLITRAHAGALTEAQRATVAHAFVDGIRWRNHVAAQDCADCDHHPEGLCERHAQDLDQAAAYEQLGRDLGLEVPQ
jgi:hypothetical protein